MNIRATLCDLQFAMPWVGHDEGAAAYGLDFAPGIDGLTFPREGLIAGGMVSNAMSA
ncbi:MAG: hypothetical protein AAFY35_02930 [Pseudomonadota bacterium]